MDNFLVVILVAVIVISAVTYIRKEKRRGVQCIGCPDARSCSGNCAHCTGCADTQK